LIIAVLGAVSQMEREMISEKTKQGLENCKAKGIQLGRKRTISHESIIALSEEGNLSVRAIARLQSCSPSSVSRILKKHNRLNF
jgi:DNA invertase Pin-like site-specific DNA recombinase